MDNDATNGVVSPALKTVERRDVRANVWRRTFLRHLQQHGSPSKAAQAAGISLSLVYRARDQRPRFKRAWERALKLARRSMLDRAEAALANRSIDGWAEPVYQMGREVGTKQRYDHAGLRFLLEHNSKRYAPKATAGTTVNVQVNVANQHRMLADPKALALQCELDAIYASPQAALEGPGSDPPSGASNLPSHAPADA